MTHDDNGGGAFCQWAILEIMGHQRYAGRVSEATVGGQSFVRIDVPGSGACKPLTKFFGAGSIYAITPIEEDVARVLAAKLQQQPIDVWDLPGEWRDKIRGGADDPVCLD